MQYSEQSSQNSTKLQRSGASCQGAPGGIDHDRRKLHNRGTTVNQCEKIPSSIPSGILQLTNHFVASADTSPCLSGGASEHVVERLCHSSRRSLSGKGSDRLLSGDATQRFVGVIECD
jgi:hypothetical protein